jgi:hypothetical protein
MVDKPDRENQAEKPAEQNGISGRPEDIPSSKRAPNVPQIALAFRDAGLSVLPVARDGSKAPDWTRLPRVLGDDGLYHPKWEPLQEELPSREDVARMFGGSRPPGIAVIGGGVSGGLECLDFDAESETIFPAWCELVEAERPGLVARLSVAKTPKPGYHVRYRCPDIDVPGNTKLAMNPAAPPAERCLIETRGEGGYALAPGCPADCHETGRLYEHHSGPELENVQAVGIEEREVLVRAARSFDRSTQEESPGSPKGGNRGRGGDGLSPGDDFNRRGPDFLEIMEPHGWELARKVGKARYVRRPGKKAGWSGTLDVCTSDQSGPLFACFSSNASPFDGAAGGRPCSCYSRFAVYTLLNHGGDFSAAAKDLAEQGYGARREGGQDRSGFGSDPIGEKPKPNPRGRFPDPVACSQLRRQEAAARWLWDGYLARGELTLFSALWKSGKTTLLSHLLRAFERGGTFCGRKVLPARVLYVTEESEHRWAERREALGLKDHLSFLIRPFHHKPDTVGWLAFIDYLQRLLDRDPVDLIVLDTLSNLWPVKDENDAAQVQAALMPLHGLTEHAALLPVHHLRKGDGQEATGTRGSGALTAFADTIIELRRFNPGDRKDRRRVLTGYGRWDDTPEELVVELLGDGSGYHAQGDRQQVADRELRDQIMQVLPTSGPGLTEEAIREGWPSAPPPGKQRLLSELRRGTDAGDWHREGEGKRGSPYTFWVRLGV